MQIRSISQCNKRLDFRPRQDWPVILPHFCWGEYQLSGFQHPDKPLVDLSSAQHTWVEALVAVHPHLRLAEWARLWACLCASELHSLPAEAELARRYGWHLNDRLQQTLRRLLELPLAVQDWMDEKYWSPRDLSPLLALNSVDEIAVILKTLMATPASKSESVRAFELHVELLLLDHSVDSLTLQSGESVGQHLSRLESLRRPRTQAQDQEWIQRVRQWPWPAHTQGQWQRLGDQGGIEIRLHTSSAADLRKKIEGLEQIQSVWSCQN